MTHADWTTLTAGVRLVATDLDGTLLREDGSVSAYTVDALARARGAGLPVVFVTGRPPRWLPMVAEATAHGGVAICANGAVLVDLASGEVRGSHAIPADVVDEVVAILRAEVPGVGFAAEWLSRDGTGFGHEDAYLPRFPAPGAVLGADVRALVAGRDVVKVLARAAPGGHDADSLLDHAAEHVAHLVTVTHSDSGDVLLEMSAAGVSKGSTLASYAEGLGLSASAVAAAGDMPNDVPMVAWAGVGLAVEAAHPRVHAVADAVLPGPHEDGVARFVSAVLDGSSSFL